MTQAQLADTLAGCVNQQINQELPGNITGIRDHLRGQADHAVRRLDDGEVTVSPGMMPRRAGAPGWQCLPGS